MTDVWADQYTDPARYRRWPSEDVIRFLASRAPWKENEPRPVGIDIGCGAGGNLWALMDFGYEAYGLDPSRAARQAAQANLLARLPGKACYPVFAGTMESIPFDDDTFDVAIEVATLQHITDYSLRRQALREVRRVLKPGGDFLSIHLLAGTDYLDVFPTAPPVHLSSIVALQCEVQEALDVVGLFETRRVAWSAPYVNVRYGVVHGRKP